MGGVHLHVSSQNIVDCTVHISGGHNKDAKFVADSFFDPTNEIYPEKKLVELNMFNGSSVYRKAKQILKFIYPIMSFIVGAEHTCHKVLKWWAYSDETTKICREANVC